MLIWTLQCFIELVFAFFRFFPEKPFSRRHEYFLTEVTVLFVYVSFNIFSI